VTRASRHGFRASARHVEVEELESGPAAGDRGQDGRPIWVGIHYARESEADLRVGPQLSRTAASVPVGFTTFPGEIWAAPRSWVETVYPDLAYFNEVDRGGHFAAWEEPELFSTELRAAFSSLR
jgi:hypothetical protein